MEFYKNSVYNEKKKAQNYMDTIKEMSQKLEQVNKKKSALQ
jgi:hypothetical protein